MLHGAAIERDQVVLESHMTIGGRDVDETMRQGFAVRRLDDSQPGLHPENARPVRRGFGPTMDDDAEERRQIRREPREHLDDRLDSARQDAEPRRRLARSVASSWRTSIGRVMTVGDVEDRRREAIEVDGLRQVELEAGFEGTLPVLICRPTPRTRSRASRRHGRRRAGGAAG